MKNYRDITPFLIPDEHSFLKKLILTRPLILHKDIEVVFSYLSKRFDGIELVENTSHFSLYVPTLSQGVRLEYMFLTSLDEGKKYLSVYPRLFMQSQEGQEQVFESDAFIRPSALVINAPIDDRLEGLAYLMQYLIKDAPNVEVMMLTLADGVFDFKQKSIVPFVQNCVARKMLLASLEDVPYERAQTQEDLARDITMFCDIPIIAALEGVETLIDYENDIVQSERVFMPQYASSITTMMHLFIAQDTLDALLDKGFESIAEHLIKDEKLLNLQKCQGLKEQLKPFEQIDPAEVLNLNLNITG
ncbi:MAG: hypothetical protein OEW60_08325 [Thiovulaceae bacterium]|nr:hypothetical protein [Sulfurimonadaceae bacterium]